MTIAEYKAAIKTASTKEELDDIGFQAFKEDASNIFDSIANFDVKPKNLYERVTRLIHKREHELGLLDDEAYVETDDDGNYTDKERLKQLEQDFYSSMKKIFT